jgi:hypothetical protein
VATRAFTAGTSPAAGHGCALYFSATGLEEISFAGDPAPYGVGVARLAQPPPPALAVAEQLFAFTR